ncbi:hypothetical protein BU17DRAFT_88097 [Hysterangium stoloniferum]|nr:hypothetical protein BU17DRAFT_88097 [Hysterangium stoloniferum]
MNNLHAYFALKNEQAFSNALDASRAQAQPPTPSSSAGKRSMAMTIANAADVNTRDSLGRTVLHVACSVTEPYALSYVRLLLAHPGINVNVQDVESRWTALHRALYVGNVSACQLLLRRFDIDTQLRDNEGLTAFDLYNLTVEGTRPLKSGSISPGQDPLKENMAADLFTWETQHLGMGGANDAWNKFTPVQVKAISMAKLHTTVLTNEKGPNLRVCGFGSGGRLGPTHHTQYTLLPIPQIPHTVIAVAPAQDHTLVLTSRNEVWSWGLNRFSQLGYVVESSPSSAGSGSAVRLGGGGLSMEEPIQHVPKRVAGVLKKEDVMGVAACKMASACWTKGEVFTWGTNNGQLGYDSAAQAVQILPRKVTGVQDVVGIALTDTAMACLLTSHDVICFRENTRFRVKFLPPTPSISSLQPYAPPLPSKTPIVKITACEGVFGALSVHGDVWTFGVPAIGVSGTAGSWSGGIGIGEGDRERERERCVVKPQRVWAAKRSINPARDIALGSDGDLIVCTESGHVFVRSRASASSGNTNINTNTNPTKPIPGSTAAIPITTGPTPTLFALSITPPPMTITTTTTFSSSTPATTKGKFHRVPFIHRAVAVCANAAGAFGALRLNYVARSVDLDGDREGMGVELGQDLGRMAPWRGVEDTEAEMEEGKERGGRVDEVTKDEEAEADSDGRDHDQDAMSSSRSRASSSARRLIRLVDRDKESRKKTGRGIFGLKAGAATGSGTGDLPHGADMVVQAQTGMSIPVHRLILGARSTVLKDLFDAGGGTLRGGNMGVVITVTYHGAAGSRSSNKVRGKGSSTLPWRHPCLTITNIRPLPILLLLEFLYADAVPVLDTLRFAEARQVCSEALALARLIGVGDLLGGDGDRLKTVKSTLGRHLWGIFEAGLGGISALTSIPTAAAPASESTASSASADVFLQLSDTLVPCHSLILRARCTFFKHFFEEEAWTVNRWTSQGTICVDLGHMRWRPVMYALEWMYGVGEKEGKEGGLFDDIGIWFTDDIDSVQDLIDFIFDVMAVASELLLDRLLLLCSNALLKHITLTNVHPILARATYLNVLPLIASLQDYITMNLEGLMETRLLDREHEHQQGAESNTHLISALGTFIRARQADNAPFTHGHAKVIMDEALKKHAKWLEEQDIPGPIVRSQGQRSLKEKNSPRLVPSARRVSGGLRGSPPIGAGSGGPAAGDDIFVMEDVSGMGESGAIIPPLNIGPGVGLPGPPPAEVYAVPKVGAWGVKAGGTGRQSRVDMKTIMAETETATLARTPSGMKELLKAAPSTSTSIPSLPSTARRTQRISQRERRQVSQTQAQSSAVPAAPAPAPTPTPPRPLGASPWHLPPQQASTATSPVSISVQHPPHSTQASTSASTPTPTTAVSFAAIQQQQERDQGHSREKQSLSLREIQEEERAKREEEAFMRWWAAEEERVKVEQAQAARLPVIGGPNARSSGKNRRGGGARRGGRGRDSKGEGRAVAGAQGRGEKDATQTAVVALRPSRSSTVIPGSEGCGVYFAAAKELGDVPPAQLDRNFIADEDAQERELEKHP